MLSAFSYRWPDCILTAGVPGTSIGPAAKTADQRSTRTPTAYRCGMARAELGFLNKIDRVTCLNFPILLSSTVIQLHLHIGGFTPPTCLATLCALSPLRDLCAVPFLAVFVRNFDGFGN